MFIKVTRTLIKLFGLSLTGLRAFSIPAVDILFVCVYLCVISQKLHVGIVDVAQFLHHLVVDFLPDTVHVMDSGSQFLSQDEQRLSTGR